MTSIAFIGGGNMAASLIGGLCADGRDAATIRAADPSAERLSFLASEFGISTSTSNDEAIKDCNVVVLAVKPQVLKTVASSLSTPLQESKPLLISVAAGVTEPAIRRWVGYDASIVRTMPNTPALVSAGATALFANQYVDDEQSQLAQSIMGAVGLTVWVNNEEQLDAVTAVSGSGPAYCFLLLELMTETGLSLGLDSETCRKLAVQTMLGAAKMAQQSDVGPDVLRQRVTSPGGTTERALQIFADNDMQRIVQEALTGARDRAAELGQQLGEQ